MVCLSGLAVIIRRQGRDMVFDKFIQTQINNTDTWLVFSSVSVKGFMFLNVWSDLSLCKSLQRHAVQRHDHSLVQR